MIRAAAAVDDYGDDYGDAYGARGSVAVAAWPAVDFT